MAIFRDVKRHQNSGMWAYVEWSDENLNHFQIVGNREFQEKQDAIDYSKGFATESYEWIEPIEIKRKRLLSEKSRIEKRLIEIEKEFL